MKKLVIIWMATIGVPMFAYAQTDLKVNSDQTVPSPSNFSNIEVSNGATLTINGDISLTGNLIMNEGTIRITNSAEVTLNGSIELKESTSTLIVESGSSIDGTDGGNFDIVNSGGSVTLNGTISVKGNVKNYGTIEGTGTVSSTEGSIENFGTMFGSTDNPPSFCVDNVCSNGSLPITLYHFEGQATGSVVQLNWSTASEENNELFEVQRSVDGENFQVLEVLNGAGSTFEQQHYQYTDKDPLHGTAYYRLRQVDFNGEFSFSPVITINAEVPDMRLYPNPSNGTAINVAYNSSNGHSTCYIQVMNLAGQEVYTEEINGAFNGQGVFNLTPPTPLPRGQYMVVVRLNGQAHHERLLVQ